MFDPNILLVAGMTLGGVVLVMILGHVLQLQAHAQARDRARADREAVTARVEESLDLSRRNAENFEKLLRLTEQSVRNQDEMIRLLRQAAGREDGGEPAASRPTPESISAAPRG